MPVLVSGTGDNAYTSPSYLRSVTGWANTLVAVVTADSTWIVHADIALKPSRVFWEWEELHDHLGDLTCLIRLHRGQSPHITPVQSPINRTRKGPCRKPADAGT